MWRSLVAHYTGGVVVVGSNPAIPTKFKKSKKMRISLVSVQFIKYNYCPIAI